MSHFRLAALALLLFPTTLFAQKRPIGLNLTSTAEAYGEAIGQTFSFVCPASDGGTGYVYGTDEYTHNSAICKAAIHAGVLKPRTAGVVTLTLGGPTTSFLGTTRNGVTTSSYRGSHRSYRFVSGAAVGGATWETTWSNVPLDLNTSIPLQCPAGGPGSGTVWGTTIYAGGSSICAAAMHAGAITPQGGAIEVRPAVQSGAFVASARNGITSLAWAAPTEAFTVKAAAAAAPLAPVVDAAGLAVGEVTLQHPDATPPMARAAVGSTQTSATGPRIVNTNGITGVGDPDRSNDVIINVPLNLTQLSPAVAKLRITCEMSTIGPGVGGGYGAEEVSAVGGKYVGTVAVYVLTNAKVVPDDFPAGRKLNYYCAVSAMDRAGGGVTTAALVGRSTFGGEITW